MQNKVLAFSHKKENIFLTCFFLITLFFSTFFLDWSNNWNTVSRISLPLSLALEQTLTIDTYQNFTGDKAQKDQHYYSDKSPLVGILTTPIIKTLDYFVDLKNKSPQQRISIALMVASFLFGALPFTFLVFFTIKDNNLYKKNGVLLVYFAFFGSFLFAFSGTYFSHSFCALLLLLAFKNYSKNNFFVSGLLLGACFMTEYFYLFAGMVWGVNLLLQKKIKSAFLFALGVVPFLLLQGLYNYYQVGSPFEFAYKYTVNFQDVIQNYGFSIPSFTTLFHLTISSYRGVFFYTPFLILILWNIWKKKKKLTANQRLIWVTFVVLLLLFSANKNWYGGWSYGPRHLYAITAVVLYSNITLLEWNKSNQFIYILAGVWGIVGSFLNKFTLLYPSTDINFPFINELDAYIYKRLNQGHLFPYYIEGYFPSILFVLLFVAGLLFLNRLQKSTFNPL